MRLLHAMTIAATALSVPAPAKAYQIDCAILLCLAGGFPPSAVCSQARAVMIRRITPFPIQPPLQLWNCPMGASTDTMPTRPTERLWQISTTFTPPEDYMSYVQGISVYQVEYAVKMVEGDCFTQAQKIYKGTYNSDGDFSWSQIRPAALPEWIFQGQDLASCHIGIRAVGISWKDHFGIMDYEIVNY